MSRLLRVALVHPFCWPEVRRGGERYLTDLAWYLAKAGHSVTVVTGTTGAASVTTDDGVSYHRLRHRLPAALARRGMTTAESFGALAFGHLARHRYDVVFALMPTSATAARLTGHRTVFSIIGHPTPEAVDHRPWLRRSFGLAIQLSNSTAVLSEASAVAAEEVFARRPIVLSPGIRLDGFPMDGAPRTGPPRILFPAYAEDPRKGLQTLLLAMPAILRRHPDARLILGGPGRHEHALESLEPTDRDLVTDALDVSGPGQLEDVPARYRAATVTVLPSVDEAFGLVLVESLASGTPIVCTTSGGPAEIVSPEVGWAVAPRDPQALADAVCHAIVLASQPDTAAKCRSRARRWDWTEVVGSAHEQVLQSVARRRSLS